MQQTPHPLALKVNVSANDTNDTRQRSYNSLYNSFPTPISMEADSPSTQETSSSFAIPRPQTTNAACPCHPQKRKSSKPVKSPSRAESDERITEPGFIIQLGFGLHEDGKIVRAVNYERIPIRVVRNPSPSVGKSAKNRRVSLQLTSGFEAPLVKRPTRARQSFTAFVNSMPSPRAPSARISSAAILSPPPSAAVDAPPLTEELIPTAAPLVL